jgi:hypothetical protein
MVVYKKTKRHRQPLIGARNTPSLPVVAKNVKTKALFVSRFSPEVTADDVHKSIVEQLGLNKLVCTRLKTKFNTYASFHVSVAEDEFPLINDSGVWPTGCLIAPYYGRLTPDQVFTPITPDAEVPPASNSLTNPVDNDAAVQAAPHPAD